MGWNSSRNWHEHRHHGNLWIFPLIFIGLIVLTHGWILILPLIVLAAIVVPKIMWHMHEGDWHGGDWSSYMNEKRKRYTRDWDEKPKRDNPDKIEYV